MWLLRGVSVVDLNCTLRGTSVFIETPRPVDPSTIPTSGFSESIGSSVMKEVPLETVSSGVERNVDGELPRPYPTTTTRSFAIKDDPRTYFKPRTS